MVTVSALTWTSSEEKPPVMQIQWTVGMRPYPATEQKMSERSCFHCLLR